MKHVFYLHSNICIITVRDIIFNLIKENKDVVVILDRKAEWTFDIRGLQLFDLQKDPKYASYRRIKTRTLKKYLYEQALYKYFKKIVNDMIPDENYLLYIPHYNIPIVSIMANNNKCKGYFFIEEGTLSYLRSEQLKKNTNYNRVYRILALILKFNYYPAFYINEKFRGSIAISESAFPWNKKNKIISHIQNTEKSDVYDREMHIIILSHLEESAKDTIDGIDYILKWLRKNQINNVYIKFHPHSYVNQKEKVKEIKTYLADKLKLIKELSNDYIIEYNLMYGKSSIYNVFHVSSLSIYAKRFNCKSFLLKGVDKVYTISET